MTTRIIKSGRGSSHSLDENVFVAYMLHLLGYSVTADLVMQAQSLGEKYQNSDAAIAIPNKGVIVLEWDGQLHTAERVENDELKSKQILCDPTVWCLVRIRTPGCPPLSIGDSRRCVVLHVKSKSPTTAIQFVAHQLEDRLNLNLERLTNLPAPSSIVHNTEQNQDVITIVRQVVGCDMVAQTVVKCGGPRCWEAIEALRFWKCLGYLRENFNMSRAELGVFTNGSAASSLTRPKFMENLAHMRDTYGLTNAVLAKLVNNDPVASAMAKDCFVAHMNTLEHTYQIDNTNMLLAILRACATVLKTKSFWSSLEHVAKHIPWAIWTKCLKEAGVASYLTENEEGGKPLVMLHDILCEHNLSHRLPMITKAPYGHYIAAIHQWLATTKTSERIHYLLSQNYKQRKEKIAELVGPIKRKQRSDCYANTTKKRKLTSAHET